jgi:hypothetical protein
MEQILFLSRANNKVLTVTVDLESTERTDPVRATSDNYAVVLIVLSPAVCCLSVAPQNRKQLVRRENNGSSTGRLSVRWENRRGG